MSTTETTSILQRAIHDVELVEEKRRQAAYQAGYQAGSTLETSARNAGYDDGFEAGLAAGKDRREGYSEGDNAGYNAHKGQMLGTLYSAAHEALPARANGGLVDAPEETMSFVRLYFVDTCEHSTREDAERAALKLAAETDGIVYVVETIDAFSCEIDTVVKHVPFGEARS